jgi:hypothetical protein
MKRLFIYILLLVMPAGVWAQDAAVKKIIELEKLEVERVK